MKKLLKLFSQFPIFENEKQVFTYLEEFLAENFLIRPMLVYSVQEESSAIDLKKARTVLGKNDRLELYSTRLLTDFLSKEVTGKANCYSLKIDNCFYHYLHLGVKRAQSYFALFASTEIIDLDILEGMAEFSVRNLLILEKYEQLNKALELIHIDDVTGLYNQRKLYKDLHLLSEKFQKEQEPFCILFIDIDRFKLVNDVHGHLVGTKLLEDVAGDIKKSLRDADYVYRYGGDEFVVILVSSDAEAGKIVGERILNQVKSRVYEFNQKDELVQLHLSVSIGVAEFPTDARSSDEVLALADRMMYVAKEYGRGVVFNTNDIFKASLEKFIKVSNS